MLPSSTHLGLLLLFFVVGVAFGSFGNVLILRIPRGWSIFGRSHCIACQKPLLAWELIPLLSFFVLGGRCSGCGRPISVQYPLVELASGLVAVLALLHTNFQLLPAVVLALALWLLLIICVIDARTQLIPDLFNIPFVALCILYAFLVGTFNMPSILIGAGFFFVQWLVSRGRWMGSGDIFLGAGAGALLGHWSLALLFLLSSYIIGGMLAAGLLLFRHRTVEDSLAFGPFLGIGTITSLTFGPVIIQWIWPL